MEHEASLQTSSKEFTGFVDMFLNVSQYGPRTVALSLIF